MLGYLDQPEETAKTLKTHADGKIWLHTGDIGTMDADGFFYFKLRQKRMIKSSGMNVYPAQVEDVLYQHPDVLEGLRHRRPRREAGPARQGVRRPEGPGEGRSAEMEKALIAHCQEHLIRWSCPREIEFRNDLPCTLVGKVAFNTLEEEEVAKLKAEGKYCGPMRQLITAV